MGRHTVGNNGCIQGGRRWREMVALPPCGDIYRAGRGREWQGHGRGGADLLHVLSMRETGSWLWAFVINIKPVCQLFGEQLMEQSCSWSYWKTPPTLINLLILNFVVLEIKPRILHMLGKCYNIESHPGLSNSISTHSRGFTMLKMDISQGRL